MHLTPNAARVVFICSLLFGLAPSATAAKPKWIKASTDEVYIISDAAPKVVTEYAVKYSAFRQAFAKILAPEGRPPPPVLLMLFRNEKEFKEHLARSGKATNTIAVNLEVDNTAMLFLSDSGDRDEALSLAFEFDTIWSLRRVGYLLPLWVTQGTGEVMATMRLKKGEGLIGGDLARVTTDGGRGPLLPWKRFFDINQSSPEYSGKDANGTYQSQAWALMNFILLQEEKPRERFADLMKKIYERQSEVQVVEGIVGLPMAKWENVIGRQTGGSRTIRIPFDEQALLNRLKIEPADEAEVMIRESDLLVARGREAEGDALVEQAAVLAPQAIYVNEALARRELRRQDQTAAARYYRLAMEAGSTNTNAWLISAAERLAQVQSYGGDLAGGGNAGTGKALDEVHHALQLDAGDLNAWRLLGRVYFVLENADAAGLADLSRAVVDDENGLHVRYYRGLLHSRLDQIEAAMADLNYVATHANTPPALRRSAENFKIQLQFGLDKNQVERLLKAGKHDEARAVVAKGLDQAAGTAMANPYRELLDWIEENACWSRIVKLFNRREWSETLSALKKFSDDYPHSTLSKEARKLTALAEESNRRATRVKAPQE